MPDPAPINTGGLLGTILGGYLGGTQGGSSPAGTTTTTTGQTLAPGALQNIIDTISGRFLDPTSNPYLSNTYDAAARQVTPRVNSIFEAGGRYGSGAHQGVLGQNLSDLANNIYGTNYQNERTRQFAAATSPIGSTQTSPYFTNPLAGILSGALGGGALGNIFGGSGGFGGILNGLPGWLGTIFGGGGGGNPAGYPQGDPNIDPGTGLLPPPVDTGGGGEPGTGYDPGFYSGEMAGSSPTFGGSTSFYPKPISTSPYARRIG
jgi:hypothetical protein